MKSYFLIIVIIFFCFSSVLGQYKIIDMHIHSYENDEFKHQIKDYWGNTSSKNSSEHFEETYQLMQRFGIEKAVVSGNLKSLKEWTSKDTENRIIKGIYANHPSELKINPDEFERLYIENKIDVFGEIGAYYSGTTLNDSIWQPYLEVCERLDIPVAVHTGGGDPGGTYTWSPKARLYLSNPLLIEDVLVRYPKLRIYLMHSGEVFHEEALRLMAYYPQVYSDLGAMLWVEPITQRYIVEFLKNAKQAGILNRVMYGTDQMLWPGAIEMSVNFLKNLDFLTEKEKQDIFYNNAATFLKIN